ncbi:MAG: L-threonine 3-dehydrogenase [Phycisphaeraceae bacterium]|nr:MAG: L-threonine 3-dehydrogenase [Phycisphaeraceae bacterium]
MTTVTTPPTASSPAKSLPATMRALVKEKAAPGLAFQGARPLPKGSLRGVAGAGQPGEPGATEALIRVTHTGICGTDRHIWEWDDWASSRIPVGIITGHEFVGVVERVGSSVEGIKPGMRVSAEGHITAGADYNSRTGNAHIARDTSIIGVDRDGCFADYIMMPACNLWQVHESIPDNWAAVMDPLGNAVHTVMAAGVSAKSVLVTGVGTIGLMAVTVARAAGAARIFAVDVDERRLDLARRLGADHAFDARKGDDWIEEVRTRTRGEGADALLEMSGAPSAIDAGFKALRNGGVAALLGIPSKPFEFDLTRNIVFKGAAVLGINGRRMFETWYQMEDLLMSGRVHLDDVLTHEFPLEEYEKAFDAMRSGEAIKVVMRM